VHPSTTQVSTPSRETGRLRGLVFAKQFPSAAEPLRGLFVAEQVRATRDVVDWRVISAVPWVPRAVAGLLGKAYVRGDEEFDSIQVLHPRYPVLPRRLLYSTVAPAVARCSRGAFARVVREHDPRFIHVHALYPSGAALRRLAADAGIPYVVTIHGSDLYSNLEHQPWREELRETVWAAAAVVCVSDSLARDAVALIGADPTRTTVIPDTYDDVRFHFRERAAHQGPKRLVTVGRLVPVKGHDVLLRALARVIDAGLSVELSIVGAGSERAALERLAAELGISDRVRFTGALGAPDLVDELYHADAYVLPSHREGFGVALVEALATGLPAVVTRSGGPESIVGATDGVVVTPGDEEALASGIERLVRDLSAFDGGAIAEGVRRRFGSAVIGDRLTRLYRAVVEDRVPGYLVEGEPIE